MTAKYAVPLTHEPTGLDPLIAPMVGVLRAGGVMTDESCDGGKGHAFPEPTIRFGGSLGDGFTALGLALAKAAEFDLRVSELRRVWLVYDAEVHGPWWDLTFRVSR